MDEALQYLRGLRGHGQPPLIAFIGHICRTWFVDESVTCAVMEILRETLMYRPVHSRPCGFDLLIKDTAERIGLVGVETPWSDGRDPVMLDGVVMVVAFPVEDPPEVDEFGRRTKAPNKKRKSWTTADPALTDVIRAMGLPVLVVYRDGTTEWVPGGET